MAAYKLPPQPIGSLPGSALWNDWIEKLRTAFNNGQAGVLWSNINFGGSNITDIVTREHNTLQNLQGGTAGELYHLTSAQNTGLTGGGDSTLHFHSSDRARANHTGTQDHNTTLSGLQGGSAGERYHLTSAQNTTVGTLTSGTYTPTITNIANVAASTALACQYMRVGSVVTVSGAVNIDPTAAAATTTLDISLPIASNLGVGQDCGGTACAPNVTGYVAGIFANAAGNTARLQFINGADVANQYWAFHFTYRII